MTGVETRLKRLTTVLGAGTPDAGMTIYRSGFFHAIYELVGTTPGIVETLAAILEDLGITPIREDRLLLEMGGQFQDGELDALQKQDYENRISRPIVDALKRAGADTLDTLEQALRDDYDPGKPFSVWDRIVFAEIRQENAEIPLTGNCTIRRETASKKEVSL